MPQRAADEVAQLRYQGFIPKHRVDRVRPGEPGSPVAAGSTLRARYREAQEAGGEQSAFRRHPLAARRIQCRRCLRIQHVPQPLGKTVDAGCVKGAQAGCVQSQENLAATIEAVVEQRQVGVERLAHADEMEFSGAACRRCPVLFVANDVLAAVRPQEGLDQRAAGLVVLQEAERFELDHGALRTRTSAAARAMASASAGSPQNRASCATCAAGSRSSSV